MLAHDVRHRPKLPTSFFRVYQALALLARVRTQLGQLFTTHAFQTQSRVTGNLPPGVYDPPVFRGGASRARRKTEKGYNLLFASREVPPALSISCSGEVPTVNTSSVTTVVQLGEMCETPIV